MDRRAALTLGPVGGEAGVNFCHLGGKGLEAPTEVPTEVPTEAPKSKYLRTFELEFFIQADIRHHGKLIQTYNL